MLTRWSARLRALRRWVSRSEWVAWLLKLPRSEGSGTSPGLLMIQIDALSRHELELAIKHNRMPFLRRLMEREGYRLHDFYSGLPSTTPAVQAELFYGIRAAVPAFAYRDRDTGELVRMFHPDPSNKVEARLRESATGLLAEGSAYCDIYSGGATDSQYCAVDAGLSAIWKAVNPLRMLSVILWHAAALLRVLALIVIEIVIALADVLHGTLRGRDLMREMKFILNRVAVSITLRELSTNGAMIDVARGIPIVHVNLLGYDEHAHQRGPNSKFAHWVLKGADTAVSHMWRAARRSARRDYDIWIYADHGQEKCLAYMRVEQQSIQEAVEKVIQAQTGQKFPFRVIQGDDREGRSNWLGNGPVARWTSGSKKLHPKNASSSSVNEVMVIAIGPVGHVYLGFQELQEQSAKIARALVDDANVPMVLRPLPKSKFLQDGGETLQALVETRSGTFTLPDDAAEVFGADHPFLEEVARDFAALCHHPEAGELVLSGYRKDEQNITFALEVGAHGGPGKRETHAFALLPGDTALPNHGKPYLRPEELRRSALHALGRETLNNRCTTCWTGSKRSLRVMTYNVHACIGMDAHLSLRRIARVIEQSGADVIALQELDVMRRRTGGIDQVAELANLLTMDHFFHPAVRYEEELYGHAILSRVPMRLVQSELLPGNGRRPMLEPRGAIWVELMCDGQPIHLINTHLGLNRGEQLEQAKTLLGERWLAHPNCSGPRIVCGDFNARPKSRVYRMFRQQFRDVQFGVNGHRPRATWLSVTPFNRIDHIFLAGELEVMAVGVPNTTLTRVASDHLPLWADIQLPPRSV